MYINILFGIVEFLRITEQTVRNIGRYDILFALVHTILGVNYYCLLQYEIQFTKNLKRCREKNSRGLHTCREVQGQKCGQSLYCILH